MKRINYYKLLIGMVILLSVIPAKSQSQCDPNEVAKADEQLRKYTSELKVGIKSSEYNSVEKTVCVCVDGMTDQEFVLLGNYAESNPILMSQIPSDAETVFIRMGDMKKGLYCEHVFYRQLRSGIGISGKPADLAAAEKRLKTAETMLAARKSELSALVKQQKEMATDDVNLLGEVLISVIPSTGVKAVDREIENAAKELKQHGINAMSEALDIYYEPSTNKNAETVRKIITPIDKAITIKGVNLGKFCKYWEFIKRTPELGMIVGNVAAQVTIYIRQRDLEKEILRLENVVNLEKDNVGFLKKPQFEENDKFLYPGKF